MKSILEALVTVGHKELEKGGVFLVPGFAKFVVVKKPATKARKGINPLTREPTVSQAKPAREIVKARPVKAVKDADLICADSDGHTLRSDASVAPSRNSVSLGTSKPGVTAPWIRDPGSS